VLTRIDHDTLFVVVEIIPTAHEPILPVPAEGSPEGFKGMRQAEENAGALAFGPLSPEQLAQVDAVLKDGQTG